MDGTPTDENPDPVSADVYKSVNLKKRKLPVKRSDPPPPKLSKKAAAAVLLELQVIFVINNIANNHSLKTFSQQSFKHTADLAGNV